MMTRLEALIALVAFALGVIVTMGVYDYRDLQRAKEAIGTSPAPTQITPLVCEHLRGRYNPGCV